MANPYLRHAQHLLYREIEGPAAKVRTCRICGFHVTVRKGLAGAGRGYGMKYGNKARGEMIQHLNSAHRDAVDGLAQVLIDAPFKEWQKSADAFIYGYKRARN